MAISDKFSAMIKTRNVGTVDRVLRALPTPLVVLLIAQGQLSGVAAWLAAALAAGLLVTSVLGSCSVYYALGWSTCPLAARRGGGQG